MKFKSNSRIRRSMRISIACLFIALVFYTTVSSRRIIRPASPLPPLVNYQYFREENFYSTTHAFGAVSHHDARFIMHEQPDWHDFRQILEALLKSYMAFVTDKTIETWIAHGSLLGWHWNQQLLPWDTDLDVQLSAETLNKLVRYNMTEFRYPIFGETFRTYLLDINPYHSVSSRQDVANKIDARWIDTNNGKFIDITALHRQEESRMLMCKDGHIYYFEDIYPLVQSSLEGANIYVPSAHRKILQEEYGRKALVNDRFHWHVFDRVSKKWILDDYEKLGWWSWR